MVPTFGGLVRVRAAALATCPVAGSRTASDARSGRPRSRSVRIAPRRLGSVMTRLHRSSNSSSVAASTGFMNVASVSSAMASESFCGNCPFIPVLRVLAGMARCCRCCDLVLLERSVIREHRLSVVLVHLRVSV